MPDSYPKKYWWVVLIVVPVAAALIAKCPSGAGGGNNITIEGSEVGGNVQIIDTQVIFQQLKERYSDFADMKDLETKIARALNLVQGGFPEDAIPLFEEVAGKVQIPAIHNNLGTLYSLEERFEEAHGAFREGIALDPAYQPLHQNLARLYEKQGRLNEAIKHIKKAPDEPGSESLLESLQEQTDASSFEQEPNNDILNSNNAALGENIDAVISDQSDWDFFEFSTTAPPRDILAVEVKNLSTGLKPQVGLWGSAKEHRWYNATYSHQVTSGQDIRYSFSASPDAVYYVSINSLGGQGRYRLSMSPQKTFDSYEPNDEILTSKDVAIGSKVNANLIGSSGPRLLSHAEFWNSRFGVS